MFLSIFGWIATGYRVYKVMKHGHGVLASAYRDDMRPILLKAVDNPKETWDDTLMKALDKVFRYNW